MSAKRHKARRTTGKLGFWAQTALLMAMLFIGSAQGTVSAASQPDEETLGRLLPLVGSALVEAGQQDWDGALSYVGEAGQLWDSLDIEGGDAAADVNSALAQANKALQEGGNDPDKAKSSLSALAKAFNAYVKSVEEEDAGTSGAEAASGMLPKAEALLSAVEAQDWQSAKPAFDAINDDWKSIEQPIRAENPAVYAKLELGMSMIRIALQAEPPRADQALSETRSFMQLIQDYKDGKIAAESLPSGLTVADLIAVLDKAYDDVEAGLYEEANGQMASFIAKWPAVEGEVQVRSAATYDKIEIEMASVSGYLLSQPPLPDKAKEVIDEMRSQLQPFTEQTVYTAWDAAVILLREGLEAILVLAALLAYMKKTGNGSKSRWIWSGVWSGLLLSGLMAFALTYLIKQASAGSTRELIEGITGLASVILMITVGNWLHSKANMSSWNRYIDGKMSGALARGSQWSLFGVSALAVLREGAETAIFYVGMASSIAPLQLALGIGGALAALVVLAFLIIRYGTKLPVKPFFTVASILIYYLVFRFVGESIHSLQVAAVVPSHHEELLPAVGALGIYPTWETAVPQLAVLVYIAVRFVRPRGKA